MQRIKRVATTLRNNWKKTVVFSAASAYGVNWNQTRVEVGFYMFFRVLWSGSRIDDYSDPVLVEMLPQIQPFDFFLNSSAVSVSKSVHKAVIPWSLTITVFMKYIYESRRVGKTPGFSENFMGFLTFFSLYFSNINSVKKHVINILKIPCNIHGQI